MVHSHRQSLTVAVMVATYLLDKVVATNACAVFNAKPTWEAILAELHIGSIAPDSPQYTTAQSADTSEGVFATHHLGGVAFDIDTVFEMVVKGKTVFLRNMVSEVVLAGRKRFRNPSAFHEYGGSNHSRRLARNRCHVGLPCRT
jgi:hypothetical protein